MVASLYYSTLPVSPENYPNFFCSKKRQLWILTRKWCSHISAFDKQQNMTLVMANFKVFKYMGAKIFDCYNNFSNAIIFQILSDSNHEGFRQRTDILRIIQIFEYEWDCLHLEQLMENRGISHQNDKSVPKSSQTTLNPKIQSPVHRYFLNLTQVPFLWE